MDYDDRGIGGEMTPEKICTSSADDGGRQPQSYWCPIAALGALFKPAMMDMVGTIMAMGNE